MVFCLKADRWASATGNYSFRFFSPEQIDRILREGVKRGRVGSHSAIDRILKHEPGLGRAELWRRIRWLKQASNGKVYQRTAWSQEEHQILRKGYEGGWKGKQEAVRELLRRHPGWQPHAIWARAAKLGLVGKSSRVHLEGYARRTLAKELHLGSRTIQRLIVQRLLDVRDPRITRKSLEDAYKTGHLTASLHDQPSNIKEFPTIPHEEGTAATPSTGSMPGASGDLSKPPRSCRAKRIWADVARQLNVEASLIEQLIFRGVLKLYDPRVTEKSLTKFCARYGALIKTDFLDAETCDWLTASMNLAPGAGKDEAGGLEPFRKHALVVRTCEHCGRAIRGNVFFRHHKRCPERNASAESARS